MSSKSTWPTLLLAFLITLFFVGRLPKTLFSGAPVVQSTVDQNGNAEAVDIHGQMPSIQ